MSAFCNQTVLSRLRQLNFSDLLNVECGSVSDYNYNSTRENDCRHKIAGFCCRCEKNGLEKAIDDSTFKLCSMSHGSHSSDLLACSYGAENPSDATWHSAPIMFIFESPGPLHPFYKEVSCDGFTKRPTSEWYWVHKYKAAGDEGYPTGFGGGKKGYTPFILNVLLTFRLANVYITNAVKCGLNDCATKSDSDAYRPLTSLNPQCQALCVDSFLKKEIEIFRPAIIFAVGAKVNGLVRVLVSAQPPDSSTCRAPVVQVLPHPARGQQGFLAEYYRTLNFWLIHKALRAGGVVAQEESTELTEVYLKGEKCGVTKSRIESA